MAYWDFNGGYEVLDVSNDTSLKILELYYQGGAFEQFNYVLTDATIDLLHLNLELVLSFRIEFIQYLKSAPKGTNRL